MPRWPINHVSKRTCPKCGKPKDFNAKTCRACSPPPVGQAGKFGSAHPTWKGGNRIDQDGYIRTWAPTHPWPRKSGYVFEHVRVMELHLGRRLEPNETVHHKDHDRKHNELANLEVIVRGEHSRHHRKLDTHKRNRDSGGRFA